MTQQLDAKMFSALYEVELKQRASHKKVRHEELKQLTDVINNIKKHPCLNFRHTVG